MSASLSPSPRLRFFGTDGAPLAGGSLITYDNETSQPVATYNDAGMAAENPAQLPLDANGEPSYEGSPRNVFLENGKFYKFMWFDKDGNLVGICDNIGASGSGGGAGNAIVRGVENEGIKVSSMIDSSGNTVYIVALTEDVLTVLATAYIVPNGGIPKTDLAQGVQDSLDLAETSLQPGDLTQVVRVVEQSFTDAEKAMAQKNINAEEYRGNQFEIVQSHTGTGKYCKIAELIREGSRKNYCYYYFTLCLKFVVNFDASTLDGIENGTFLFSAVDYDRLNVYNDNGQWLDYDNAFKYDGISQCIKGVHILRQKTGLKVDRYEIWLEVDDTLFNLAGSISVNVLSNVGSWAYNGQYSRSERGMKAGWFKVYDDTQVAQPILLTDSINTLTDSTFVEAVREPMIAVIDNAATKAEAKALVQKGDIPFMKFGSVYAWPLVMTESAQYWAFLNGDKLQIYYKAEGHSEWRISYSLYREQRTNVTITETGESLVGAIPDAAWNETVSSLEVDLYHQSSSAPVWILYAYWKSDSGTSTISKEFYVQVKILYSTSQDSNIYKVYSGTYTLHGMTTSIASIDSSILSNMKELVVDFRSVDTSTGRRYRLEYIAALGQSRFLDMGYAN